MFFKVVSIKNFGSRSLFWKIESNTGVSCRYCKLFTISFLIEHLATSDSPTKNSKVSWCVCVLISRLHVLWVLIKTLRKRCTNNSLLSRDKKISSLLELIGHVRSVSVYALDKFWYKTYTKRCTSNCVIANVKRLSSPALRCWSGAPNFTVWFGQRKNAV